MKTNPLISVIVPTYNRGHIIDKALNSILAQSYQNWECLVVDDGSTDNTAQIINTYLKNDSRFRFYERPDTVEKGPSGSRNFGYEQSKGEYIQWFDSDDLMHPDKLKVKLEWALAKGADVIIDQHSEDDCFKPVEEFQVDCFTSQSFYIDFILGKRPIITNDVMVRKAKIGTNRFNENLFKGEEYEFYGRVFQQKLTYCFLEVALTCYRISSDSISISPKQSESLIYLSKLIKNRHIDNPDIVARAERQGRKTYKDLLKRGNYKMVLKHFNFFREVHHKSALLFGGYVLYNNLTGRGFDKMKPNCK